MTGTDGVASHIFQQCQLPAQGGYIDSCPQRAQVVVIAHALKLAMTAVQVETFVGHNLQTADAEPGSIAVNQRAIHVNAGYSLIQRRRLRRPQRRLLHYKVLFEGFSVIDFQCIVFHSHHLALRRYNFCHHPHVSVARAFNRRQQTDGCIVSIHMGSDNLRTPYRDMHRLGRYQMYIAVETRTGIPARRLRTVFQTYSQHIGSPVLIQVRSDIYIK